MSKLYRLTEAVRFEPRRAWSVQARYALAYSEGSAFTAEAGRLVIYLTALSSSDGKRTREEHVYRLSDGRIGVLETPPDDRFALVADQEAVALARQVRSLPEMLAEKGLRLDALSPLDPFTLVRCPMCGGTDFLTLDLASVWCGTCNVRFKTRSTAGDPGVVVDAHLEHYIPVRARYIVPRSLTLTIVLKDFGYTSHPKGVCGDYCANSDADVRPPAGLRPDTRPCGLEVYDWSLYGALDCDDRHRHRTPLVVEGETVNVRDRVYALRSVHSDRLPALDLLAGTDVEERQWWYLVDGVSYEPEGRQGWHPIWWKVQAVTEESPSGGFRVKRWKAVDRTLCPQCLQPAEEGDHDYCNWRKLGWEPQPVEPAD